jgi:hypothetical protein
MLVAQAILKVAVFGILLVLLLRTARWRWLIGALIVGAVSNGIIAVGADRLTTSTVGLAFIALLAAHVFDISRFKKPEAD